MKNKRFIIMMMVLCILFTICSCKKSEQVPATDTMPSSDVSDSGLKIKDKMSEQVNTYGSDDAMMEYTKQP